MISLELLLMMGVGAVFPYVAVATMDWVRQRRSRPGAHSRTSVLALPRTLD